jgi:hypothetical protein
MKADTLLKLLRKGRMKSEARVQQDGKLCWTTVNAKDVHAIVVVYVSLASPTIDGLEGRAYVYWSQTVRKLVPCGFGRELAINDLGRIPRGTGAPWAPSHRHHYTFCFWDERDGHQLDYLCTEYEIRTRDEHSPSGVSRSWVHRCPCGCKQ